MHWRGCVRLGMDFESEGKDTAMTSQWPVSIGFVLVPCSDTSQNVPTQTLCMPWTRFDLVNADCTERCSSIGLRAAAWRHTASQQLRHAAHADAVRRLSGARAAPTWLAFDRLCLLASSVAVRGDICIRGFHHRPRRRKHGMLRTACQLRCAGAMPPQDPAQGGDTCCGCG